MRRVSIGFLLCSLAVTAHAGGHARGTLYDLHFMPNGAILIYSTGAITGQPTCATANRFAIDGTTAPGKVMLAGLLTAHASGKDVSLFGTGTCIAWGDSENVEVVRVN